MFARVQQKRQAFSTKQVHPAICVLALGWLEQVQVVQLAQTLVDTATEATYGDDIEGTLGGCIIVASRVMVVFPHVRYGFKEIRRLLIGFMDDLCYEG